MYRILFFAASLLLPIVTAARSANAAQASVPARHAVPAGSSVPSAAIAPGQGSSSGSIVLSKITVTARLNLAREALDPETGTSSYLFAPQAIQALPRGENSSLQQLLLQAPGVAQDSFGQIHVRGDHADVQYRINGILLPEFISGFGATLGTRFIKDLSFLTGSLPAQYGYRTAGVVNITTKDSRESGGSAGLYGGSHATLAPSLEYGGSEGKFSYYATGSYLQSDLGIESPTPAAGPGHDHTEQNRGFVYAAYRLNDNMRFEAMAGHFLGNFQIPNNPGQTPVYRLQGVTSYPSSRINETQRELGDYGIAFLQGYQGALGYQVALFGSYPASATTRTKSGI